VIIRNHLTSRPRDHARDTKYVKINHKPRVGRGREKHSVWDYIT
jgi:hypothetical protein